MEILQPVSLHCSDLLVDPAAVDNLKLSIRGRVFVPHEEEYDKARKVWNGMIDRHPALIIQCSGTADVMKAVRFAKQFNLPISVKCGGHNFGGLSVCDDGIMIDLSNMRSVRVNAVTKTAVAQGGSLLVHLDKETQSFGLATTSGTVSHTGISGITPGDGLGSMMNINFLGMDEGLDRLSFLSAQIMIG